MKYKFKRVYIEITNVCNLKCSFCSTTSKKSRTMTTEEFEHIAKQVSMVTQYVYLHVKGEPLLHNNIKDILDLCEKYGLRVNLTTNGTLLNRHIEMLKNHKAIRQVNISLHSLTQQNCDINEFMEPVVSLINAKNHPLIQLRLWTLSSDNDSTVREIINVLADKIPAESGAAKSKENDHHATRFSEIYGSVKAGNYYTLAPKVFLDYDKEFVWPSLDNEYISDRGICYGLRSMIGILCDGTVVPCCLDAQGVIDLGNIFTQSLEEILNNELAVDFTYNIKNRKLTQQLCRRCGYRLIFERGMKKEKTI